MDRPTKLAHLPLADLLAALRAEQEAPASGTAAALSSAMAAALLAKLARASAGWADAPGIGAQAEALCDRLVGLAEADADAYGAARAVLDSHEGAHGRDALLRGRLSRAADVPLAIAEAALDVAALAADIARRGDPAIEADAASAAFLAAGAVRVAAHLVAVNLTAVAGDERTQRARLLVEEARSLADALVTGAEAQD